MNRQSATNILLIDFDGKMENLALMRLSAWHKSQGDIVNFQRVAQNRSLKNIHMAYPQLFERPSKVYISCLFRWNAEQALFLQSQWNGTAEIGGTGVDITKTLPDHIANITPDYDLYKQNRAIGFISRGCCNRCPWCVVWRKEGQLARVSTAQDIVNSYRQAIFLDNNFLALHDHERDLHWLAEQQVAIDFNQGLDAKYVTPSNAKLMARCKWIAGPRLALDADSRQPIVERALAYFAEAGMPASKLTLFILIGFHGLETDVYRLLQARQWGIQVYPMGFRNLDTGNEPAIGWDRRLYNKYRRLMIRIPQATSVWEDFNREVVYPNELN